MINEAAYQKKEIEHEGMKVSLEFPEPAENGSMIRKEVKNILIDALQEQMKKISWY